MELHAEQDALYSQQARAGRKWVCPAGGILVLLGLVSLFLADWNQPPVSITNSNPAFKVISVQITRGTNHVYYFPNRLRFWEHQTGVFLTRWVPSLVPPMGAKISLNVGTGFPSDDQKILLCWIQYKSERRLFHGMVLNPTLPFVGPPGHTGDCTLTVPPPYRCDQPGLFRRRAEFRFDEFHSPWDPVSRRGLLCWSSSSKFTNFSGGKLEVATPLGKSTIHFR